MTAIFVLRHPQTTWNRAERYQGRLEAPLSELGRQQSARLVKRLSQQRFDAVFSSPLLRAFDLARDLAHSVHAPLTVDGRLTEIAMGPWEGLYRTEIEARYPELYAEWYAYPERVRFPAGESAQEVQGRAARFMSTAIQAFPSGRVLVVTHSVVVQTLVAWSLGLSLSQLHRIRVTNGGITIFCGDTAPPYLVTMNGLETLHDNPVAAAIAAGCATDPEGRATA